MLIILSDGIARTTEVRCPDRCLRCGSRVAHRFGLQNNINPNRCWVKQWKFKGFKVYNTSGWGSVGRNSAGSAPSKVGGKFFTPSAEAKKNRQKKTQLR